MFKLDQFILLLGQLRVQQQLQSISYFSLSITVLNSPLRKAQSGFSQNQRLRLQLISCRNSSGKLEHSLSRGMRSLRSIIFSYFSFLPLAFRFCQGRAPLTKQMSTLAMPSMSSLLPCSIPRWVLREVQRAVPVRFLLSRQGMCDPSLERYFLASPKSMMLILPALSPLPTTKLSGLMSRWRKPLLWMYSILSIIWQPTMRVVLRSNFLPLATKRSSRDWPYRSITRMLQSSSQAQQQTWGMPKSVAESAPVRAVRILASQNNWGLLVPTGYSFTATSALLSMLMARQTSPKAPDPSFLSSRKLLIMELSMGAYIIQIILSAKQSSMQDTGDEDEGIETAGELPAGVRLRLGHVEHNTVHLSSLEWGELNMNEHVGKIVVWRVADRLNLSNNKEPRIMTAIAHIGFPSLKLLNLEYNLLFSLEVIGRIWMPQLQHLNLSNNNIVHTRPLRKCSCAHLIKINLSGNRIVEWRGMAELRGSRLREIVVESDNISRVQGYDPRWFFKIEPFAIFEVFSAKSKKRIKVEAMGEQVSRRFPYIFSS